MARPRRKYTLLLCEGSSDRDALSTEIAKLYDSYDPDVIVECLIPKDDGRSHDISVENTSSVASLQGIINKVFIADFLYKNKLYPKDINRIIQIVDMDGAYISDEDVVYWDVEKTEYTKTCIRTRHVDSIRQRNYVKRRNLDYLTALEKIDVYQGVDSKSPKKIPYSVFYFSSNLDHMLHGEANLEGRMKGTMARAFKDNCRENPEQFQKTFMSDSELNGKTYEESWEYIKEGRNSLARHSNLCILINELLCK